MIRLEDSESTYDCNLNLPHYICRKFWLFKLKPPVDQPVLKMCNKAPITYNTMTAGYFQGIQQHLQMVYSIAFIYGSSQKIGKEQLKVSELGVKMTETKYISSKMAAEQLGISVRRVVGLCNNGEIIGAYQDGRRWKIPETSVYTYQRGKAP